MPLFLIACPTPSDPSEDVLHSSHSLTHQLKASGRGCFTAPTSRRVHRDSPSGEQRCATTATACNPRVRRAATAASATGARRRPLATATANARRQHLRRLPGSSKTSRPACSAAAMPRSSSTCRPSVRRSTPVASATSSSPRSSRCSRLPSRAATSTPAAAPEPASTRTSSSGGGTWATSAPRVSQVRCVVFLP